MSLIPFKYENHKVRATISERGDPWFVASDVCAVLNIGNVSKTLFSLDGYEVDMFDTADVINESGLFSLIFSAKGLEAKLFKKWVSLELLPALRELHRETLPVAESKPNYEQVLLGILDQTWRTVDSGNKLIIELANSLADASAAERRKSLAWALESGPLVVEDYAKATNLKPSVISHDINHLRSQGTKITTTRESRGTVYRLQSQ